MFYVDFGGTLHQTAQAGWVLGLVPVLLGLAGLLRFDNDAQSSPILLLLLLPDNPNFLATPPKQLLSVLANIFHFLTGGPMKASTLLLEREVSTQSALHRTGYGELPSECSSPSESVFGLHSDIPVIVCFQ